MKRQEALYIKTTEGPCDIHSWSTQGLAAHLIKAMRDRHKKGGINVCRDCMDRMKADAERLRNSMNRLRIRGNRG